MSGREPCYSGSSLVQLIYPSSVRGFAPVRLIACSAPTNCFIASACGATGWCSSAASSRS